MPNHTTCLHTAARRKKKLKQKLKRNENELNKIYRHTILTVINHNLLKQKKKFSSPKSMCVNCVCVFVYFIVQSNLTIVLMNCLNDLFLGLICVPLEINGKISQYFRELQDKKLPLVHSVDSTALLPIPHFYVCPPTLNGCNQFIIQK